MPKFNKSMRDFDVTIFNKANNIITPYHSENICRYLWDIFCATYTKETHALTKQFMCQYMETYHAHNIKYSHERTYIASICYDMFTSIVGTTDIKIKYDNACLLASFLILLYPNNTDTKWFKSHFGLDKEIDTTFYDELMTYSTKYPSQKPLAMIISNNLEYFKTAEHNDPMTLAHTLLNSSKMVGTLSHELQKWKISTPDIKWFNTVFITRKNSNNSKLYEICHDHLRDLLGYITYKDNTNDNTIADNTEKINKIIYEFVVELSKHTATPEDIEWLGKIENNNH
jgi:hypothetical protein